MLYTNLDYVARTRFLDPYYLSLHIFCLYVLTDFEAFLHFEDVTSFSLLLGLM